MAAKWPRIRSRRTTAVSPWMKVIAREVHNEAPHEELPATEHDGTGEPTEPEPEFEEIARAHHGSLAHEERVVVEELLKSGKLPCLVAPFQQPYPQLLLREPKRNRAPNDASAHHDNNVRCHAAILAQNSANLADFHRVPAPSAASKSIISIGHGSACRAWP